MFPAAAAPRKDSGLPGPRCRTADFALCQRRCDQKRTGRRDSPVRTVLEETHRQTARRTGFRSQLTTYEKLAELNREGICFITLRRRSRQMLQHIYSQPDSAWRRISLPALTRIYRNPKVLEERVTLSGYQGDLRQLTVMELGHEEPTILLTNHRKLGPVELVTRYAQPMLIENGISEAVQFFHIDALSSMVGMKVDFDMQLTLAASSLYRMMALRIGREYSHSQAKTVFRNLSDLSGKVEVTATSVEVTLDKRAHNPYLDRKSVV